MIVDVVIPALNEEEAIGAVVRGLLAQDGIRRVVVADNGSTDATARLAREAGAEVVHEPERGYGAACLKALAHLRAEPPDTVLFADGDAADDPNDVPELLRPIEHGDVDMVIGSRALGDAEQGSLTPVQRFGNTLSCTLMRWIYGAEFTDLGPFRAIAWSALEKMQMRDRNFGWTVEMQIKAAKMGIVATEVPVRYRRRIGTSKVSGTIRGSVLAGSKILYLIARNVR